MLGAQSIRFFLLVLLFSFLAQGQDCTYSVNGDSGNIRSISQALDAVQEAKCNSSVIYVMNYEYKKETLPAVAHNVTIIGQGSKTILQEIVQSLGLSGMTVTYQNLTINSITTYNRTYATVRFVDCWLMEASISTTVVTMERVQATSTTGYLGITCNLCEVMNSQFTGYSGAIPAPLMITSARVSITNSVFSSNVGDLAGALYLLIDDYSAKYTIEGTTFSRNRHSVKNSPNSASSVVLATTCKDDTCTPSYINFWNTTWECSETTDTLVSIQPPSNINYLNITNANVLQCQSFVACSEANYFKDQLFGCQPCLAGTHQDKKGQYNCTQCSPGFYSHERAVNCTLCRKGEYSQKNVVCAPCPTGTYSNRTPNASDPVPALGTISDHCTPCGKNRYAASEGTIDCEPCEGGTTTGDNDKAAYCEGLKPLSWILLVVALVVLALIIIAVIGWRFYVSRQNKYQPIDG